MCGVVVVNVVNVVISAEYVEHLSFKPADTINRFVNVEVSPNKIHKSSCIFTRNIS